MSSRAEFVLHMFHLVRVGVCGGVGAVSDGLEGRHGATRPVDFVLRGGTLCDEHKLLVVRHTRPLGPVLSDENDRHMCMHLQGELRNLR